MVVVTDNIKASKGWQYELRRMNEVCYIYISDLLNGKGFLTYLFNVSNS